VDEHHASVIDDGGTACIVLSGQVDLAARSEIEGAMEAAMAAGPAAVRVDLSAVTFLDSSGIAALIMGFREAEAAEIPFTVVGGPPPVMRAIEISGLADALGLEVDR
jgi:anti-sigma B factor antagonist